MTTCLTLPAPTLPKLPAPLSISLPAIPAIPGLPNLCCKLPPIPIPPIPIALPALILNPAVIATLNANIAIVQSYLRALPLKCPLE
jgi:hypothetical protein